MPEWGVLPARPPEPAATLGRTRGTTKEVAEMNSQTLESTRQMEFLTELVNAHTEVAADVFQIGPTTWALHGSIPFDGDVLIAEYDTFEEARAVLVQLASNPSTDGQVP